MADQGQDPEESTQVRQMQSGSLPPGFAPSGFNMPAQQGGGLPGFPDALYNPAPSYQQQSWRGQPQFYQNQMYPNANETTWGGQYGNYGSYEQSPYQDSGQQQTGQQDYEYAYNESTVQDNYGYAYNENAPSSYGQGSFAPQTFAPQTFAPQSFPQQTFAPPQTFLPQNFAQSPYHHQQQQASQQPPYSGEQPSDTTVAKSDPANSNYLFSDQIPTTGGLSSNNQVLVNQTQHAFPTYGGAFPSVLDNPSNMPPSDLLSRLSIQPTQHQLGDFNQNTSGTGSTLNTQSVHLGTGVGYVTTPDTQGTTPAPAVYDAQLSVQQQLDAQAPYPQQSAATQAPAQQQPPQDAKNPPKQDRQPQTSPQDQKTPQQKQPTKAASAVASQTPQQKPPVAEAPKVTTPSPTASVSTATTSPAAPAVKATHVPAPKPVPKRAPPVNSYAAALLRSKNAPPPPAKPKSKPKPKPVATKPVARAKAAKSKWDSAKFGKDTKRRVVSGSRRNPAILAREKKMQVNSYAPKIDLSPKVAKYFVIKSYTADDIHKSMKYGVWASTKHGNLRLNKAFLECKPRGIPIYLFFSANSSGCFCGMASMESSLNPDKSFGVWTQGDKWNGQFEVKWRIIKTIPNKRLRHIRLSNNSNKPVTNSRDTQEILATPGKEMLRIFCTFDHSSSMLEEFTHFDRLEVEMMEEKKKAAKDHPKAASSSRQSGHGGRDQPSSQSVKARGNNNTNSRRGRGGGHR